jgi:hypothetical protein
MEVVRCVVKGGIDRGRRCGQRQGSGKPPGRISRYRLRACREPVTAVRYGKA